MNRALMWKEFREQRPLIFAGWLMALVLPVFLIAGMATMESGRRLSALGPMLPITVMFLVWPAFAAATGAMTVSSDMSDGSLRFLLSRPVSRTRIWATKVGVGALALGLVVIGSMAIAAAFESLVTGGRISPIIAAGLPTSFGFLAISRKTCWSAHVFRPMDSTKASTRGERT